MHDVGKLQVSADILSKPGKPTDEEWSEVRSHPALGGELLAPLTPWLGGWIRAAADHHERFDGGGYPNGLAGEEISLGGRIVAVADAYDVMTAVRSYKTPSSPEIARAEIAANAGSQFDPDVVRAFLNVGDGKINAVAGSVAWISQFPGLAQTASTIASTGGTAATAAALTALSVTAGFGTGRSFTTDSHLRSPDDLRCPDLRTSGTQPNHYGITDNDICACADNDVRTYRCHTDRDHHPGTGYHDTNNDINHNHNAEQ